MADPHADTLESTALLLRLWGLDVRCAGSGFEVLAVAPAYRPDVVVMEVRLPDLEGCEVARRLRRAGVSAVLVAVTVYGGERHRRLILEAGFDAHLVKPACLETLRGLLNGRQQAGSRA